MRTTLTGLTSRRPFTLLGIVLALLVIAAFVLVALNSNSGAAGPQQNVVVATRDLAPRIPIDSGSLVVRAIPVPANPQLYFHTVKELQDFIPLVTIPSGQAVTQNLVVKSNQALGSQSQYLPIPSGFVAITLPTSEQQGVAGYINQNDYISVIATIVAGEKVASMTIFTNLHVIRVGSQAAAAAAAAGSGTQSTASASSLTVVVTQCQAEFLTWFLTFASLKYVLESYHDYQPVSDTKDPACPAVTSAKGVTLKQVQAAYPALF